MASPDYTSDRLRWSVSFGKYPANTLRMVRANRPKKPLVRLDAMDQGAKEKLEQENIHQCVAFARDGLDLKL